MFVGDMLEFSSPHSWLRLYGDSAYGTRLNLKSSRLLLSISIVVYANADAGIAGTIARAHTKSKE